MINHGWVGRPRSCVGRRLYRERHRLRRIIRDLFFATKDHLGVSNIQLVDLIAEALVEHLKSRKSWFSMDDFPYAETWWWDNSAREVSNKWLVDSLTTLKGKATNQ